MLSYNDITRHNSTQVYTAKKVTQEICVQFMAANYLTNIRKFLIKLILSTKCICINYIYYAVNTQFLISI